MTDSNVSELPSGNPAAVMRDAWRELHRSIQEHDPDTAQAWLQLIHDLKEEERK